MVGRSSVQPDGHFQHASFSFATMRHNEDSPKMEKTPQCILAQNSERRTERAEQDDDFSSCKSVVETREGEARTAWKRKASKALNFP
jgi:hypothetical protein